MHRRREQRLQRAALLLPSRQVNGRVEGGRGQKNEDEVGKEASDNAGRPPRAVGEVRLLYLQRPGADGGLPERHHALFEKSLIVLAEDFEGALLHGLGLKLRRVSVHLHLDGWARRAL